MVWFGYKSYLDGVILNAPRNESMTDLFILPPTLFRPDLIRMRNYL